MSYELSPGSASKQNLCDFFNVGEDKMNEILRDFGLSTRREHDWTTIWDALGLSAVQKRKIWHKLQTPMLSVKETAAIIKKHPKTVSGWCEKGEYPPGFPAPFDFGPRTKRWLDLEIWNYEQPKIYGDLAREIRRPSRSSRKHLQRPGEGAPLPTTLDPMRFV